MRRQKIKSLGILAVSMLLTASLGLAACGEAEEASGQTPETASETEQTQEQMKEAETGPESVTEPESVTDPEGVTDPESVTETENVTETESVTEPETEPEPEIVEPDVTAPVMTGVKNLTVEAGSNISYKRGVEVTDDSGESLLEIDTSTVDLNTVGTYEVVYTATDPSGNVSTQTIVVTVVNPPTVTEEQVYELADAVIASVITEEMTQLEKARALWDWCHYQIKYSYSAGDRGLLAGAWEGLHDKKGDCYAYYATYEVLLTRVGIENMCVTRIGGDSNHWWNLVNVGDGWYHCDTSPRKIGHKYKCFMQTDEQIAAYEAIYTEIAPEKHNYFTFESDLYPERATTIIYESSMP